ncbi:MAG: HU family DNA-binding protein [Lentimicrobiaceae bacterium]|jgi:DNA-binding protein HU-beta|nr:HU family DNA-binding protein [Lentimicrobiaceae bacterium]
MNKTELIAAIALKAGLTKVDAKKALDAFMETTTEVLKKNERLTLIGFGTFYTVMKEARQGINPQTKQKITIAAKKVGKFKFGAALNENIQ